MFPSSATEMRSVSANILHVNIVNDVKEFLNNSYLFKHKLNLSIRVLAKRDILKWKTFGKIPVIT